MLILNQALVRILANGSSSTRTALGMGFLISSHRILTAAHIVMEAAGLPPDWPELPTEPISLDFPLSRDKRIMKGKVEFWYPLQDNPSLGELEDIVVLELILPEGESFLPQGISPVSLQPLEEKLIFERQVLLCGFSLEEKKGEEWLNAILQKKNSMGQIPLKTESEENSVGANFSGTPIWDQQSHTVIGILVSTTNRWGDSVSYMIPMALLVEMWPVLRRQVQSSNPYKRLDAFQEKDAPYFFGRADMIHRLDELVQDNTFVSLVGASGVGKSSLVYAGLVPCLRTTGQWITLHFCPGHHPFESLAKTLLTRLYSEKEDREEKLASLVEDLRSGELGIVEISQLIFEEFPNKRMLIIVEQFEELYLLNDDTKLQDSFVKQLLRVSSDQMNGPPKVTLLLAMRSDFLSRVRKNVAFSSMLEQCPPVFLDRMEVAKFQEVVNKPASKKRVQFKEGVVEQILKDLGEEVGNLPLLELILNQLWERQKDKMITHDSYQAIGGAWKAIVEHANLIYEELNEEEQEKARSIFIELGKAKSFVFQKEMGGKSWLVVEKLVEARLLVAGMQEETGEEILEISHKALTQDWDHLQDWMEKS